MTSGGVARARRGRVTFEDADITAERTDMIVRRGIACSPEGRRIFPRMTVLENLRMGALTADPARYDENLEVVFELRSAEHTSELQSLKRTSYAVLCLNKKTQHKSCDSVPSN